MKNVVTLYVLLTAFSAVMLAGTVCISRGSYVPYFFYRDEIDTGMDFFNSLAEASDGDCYMTYHTSYPPFAEEILHCLAGILPDSLTSALPKSHEGIIRMRGTVLDLRSHQAPLLLFTFLAAGYAAMLFCIIGYGFRSGAADPLLLSVCTLISCGSLTALERGNIILFAMLFTMIFLFGHDSDKPLIRALSFLSLAAAASIKLYPALYGLMVFFMKDRFRVTAAYVMETVTVALALSLIPMRHFGGLRGLICFFRALICFSGEDNGDSCFRYGMDGIVRHALSLCRRYPFIPQGDISRLVRIILASALFMLLFAFVMHVFFADSPWKGAFDITLALILLQNKSTDYTLCFFLPVLMMLFREGTKLSPGDLVLFWALMVFILPYPSPLHHDVCNMVLRHVDLVQLCIIASVAFDFGSCVLRYASFILHGHHHWPHRPDMASLWLGAEQ